MFFVPSITWRTRQNDIRNKIVGLRSQLARELVKTNSKKSGQGRSECYKSTWVYWDRNILTHNPLRLMFETCWMKHVGCLFGIVWPPPNFQHVGPSNTQLTCWIVQHLSFGRAFRASFSRMWKGGSGQIICSKYSKTPRLRTCIFPR